MKLLYLLIFALAILFTPTEVYSQEQWELKKDADGIKVYTRLAEGSSIKEFKAITTLPVAASQILAVLKDVEKYPLWIEDVENARTINGSENNLSFYYQLDLPWPVKNRDMALDMNITHRADSIILKLTNNNNIVPVDEDFIRMHNVVGQWSLYPISSNSTSVIHQFLADPEGSIPAWVINAFIVEGPYKSMKNLESYASTYESKE
jgi:ribosome-associated toxin RatA of RatAB toxin-antitoxin module